MVTTSLLDVLRSLVGRDVDTSDAHGVTTAATLSRSASNTRDAGLTAALLRLSRATRKFS
jgi:hypothetical protein